LSERQRILSMTGLMSSLPTVWWPRTSRLNPILVRHQEDERNTKKHTPRLQTSYPGSLRARPRHAAHSPACAHVRYPAVRNGWCSVVHRIAARDPSTSHDRGCSVC
jgi:hypothetical protein